MTIAIKVVTIFQIHSNHIICQCFPKVIMQHFILSPHGVTLDRMLVLIYYADQILFLILEDMISIVCIWF